MILYESFCRSLHSNAKAIMNSIIEKMRFQRFFISYNNMNIYENVCNQRVLNCGTLLNYITRYICFIKINNCIKDGADSWKKQYINNSQIDWKLVNDLINEDLELT